MNFGDDENKVKQLGVAFKKPPGEDEPQLKVIHGYDKSTCNHLWRIEGSTTRQAQYLIRDGEMEVECGLCGTRLDPMFVLQKLAREESQWQRHRQQHLDEMKRFNERSRTKCEHCDRMTRISRR
jgi:hypothetical protein